MYKFWKVGITAGSFPRHSYMTSFSVKDEVCNYMQDNKRTREQRHKRLPNPLKQKGTTLNPLTPKTSKQKGPLSP